MAATLCFWTLVLSTLPLIYLGGWMWRLLFAWRDPNRAGLHRFVALAVWPYLRVWPGWRFRVRHAERLPEGPVVLVANHQSATDILACFSLPKHFVFVSKASMFSVPLFGRVMRWLAHIELHRGRKSSAGAMLEACRASLRRGVSVLLFPEGTYNGGTLLPFRRGAFALSLDVGVPIVPVVIRGNRAVLDEDGPLLGGRAQVEVEVLEPVDPRAFLDDSGAFAARVRALYERALHEGAGQEGTGVA